MTARECDTPAFCVPPCDACRADAEAYDRALTAPLSDETARALRDRLASGTYPRRKMRRTPKDQP